MYKPHIRPISSNETGSDLLRSLQICRRHGDGGEGRRQRGPRSESTSSTNAQGPHDTSRAGSGSGSGSGAGATQEGGEVEPCQQVVVVVDPVGLPLRSARHCRMSWTMVWRRDRGSGRKRVVTFDSKRLGKPR